MSELFKTFFFDLQRFATGKNISGVKISAVKASSLSSALTANDTKNYYWWGASSIAPTSAEHLITGSVSQFSNGGGSNYTYWGITNIDSLKLASDTGKLDLTKAPGGDGLALTNLKSYTIGVNGSGSFAGGTPDFKFTFGSADGKASIDVADGGGISAIVLPKGTLTYDGTGDLTSATWLKVGATKAGASSILTKGTKWVYNASDKTFTVNTNKATVAGAADATKLYMGFTGNKKEITLGSASTYTLNNTTGKSYFNLAGGATFGLSSTPPQFVLGGKGDAIALSGGGSALTFGYGTKGSLLSASLSGITALASGDAPLLTFVDGKTNFSVSNIGVGSIALNPQSGTLASTAVFNLGTDNTKGFTLNFTEDKTKPVITSITGLTNTGDAVILDGTGVSGKDITIDGGKVNVAGGSYAYTFLNKKNIQLALGGSASVVTAAGKANEITFGTRTDSSLKVLGTTIMSGSLSTAFGTEADSYLVVSNNKVAGVVLGSETASVAVDATTAKTFGIYAAANEDDTTKAPDLLFTPAITDAASIVSYGKISDDDYTVAGFKTKSALTSNGVSVTFASLDADNATNVKAVFSENEDTEKYYLAGISGITAGDSLDVKGATDGIYFNSSDNAVSIKSGTFGYALDADDATKPTITLKTKNDTVFSAGSSDQTVKVVTTTDSTTFAVGDADALTTYKIANKSGDAYFNVVQNAATGFNFGGKGDAITFGEDGLNDDFAVTYTNDGDTESLPGNFAVSNAEKEFTLTMTNDSVDAQEFEVSGMVADGSVTVTGAITFGEGETAGKVTFNAEQETGVEFTKSVVLDGTVAALLAEDENPFKVNGTGVIIEGISDEVSLSADGKDLTLAGLTGGQTVVDAGLVTKIMAPDEGQLTFGTGDAEQEFSIASAEGNAYFALANGKVTTFVFADEGDGITGNLSELKLQDGADGTAFTAPIVYETKGGDVVEEITVTKGETNFLLSNFDEEYYVEFADAKLTFQSGSFTDAVVEFDSTGALVGINELEDDDAVKVEDATKPITFNEEQTIEITGSAFVYTQADSPTITEVTAGATIKQTGDATVVGSASGTAAEGDFTFAGNKKTVSIVKGSNSEDGVTFIVGASAVLEGISGINGTESVSGALDGLKFNGGSESLAIGSGDYTVFGGGQSLAGFTSADKLVNAGGISDFLTTAEGAFDLFGTKMAIAGDKEVTFTTDGATTFTGIEGLGGSAIGDFTDGLSVNGISVAVTGDSMVAVVGDEEKVTKIAQLGVAGASAAIKVTAEGVSAFGVNLNGQFNFNDEANFGVAGNGSKVTEFNLSASAITGVDATETLSGNFEAGYTVNGNALQVAGDSNISIVGGTQILGLTDGAEVVAADKVTSAKTEDLGTFTFTAAGQSFTVSGENKDGVEFILDGAGRVVGISGVDDGEIITGNLNGLTINGKEPEVLVQHADGSYNTDLYYENGTLSGIVNGDTIVKADNVSVVKAGESGVFKFAGGQSFKTSDADGIDFAVKVGTTTVTAITGLAEGASLEGTLGGLSINNKLVDIKNDTDFGVVGAADGISEIYALSNGAEVVDAAGATVATTDEFGTFKFAGGQSFVTAGDSKVSFTLADNAATAITGLSAGSVLGDFSKIETVNEQTFEIANDASIEVFANAEGELSKIEKVTGGASIGEVGSVAQIVTDSEGLFTFTVGGQSFTTGDGAKEVTFGLSASEVVSIDDLAGSVEGEFAGIEINGANLDIVDGDGKLKVFGDGEKLTAIQGVDADATINAAGGVTELVGNLGASVGLFTFAGNSGAFTVADDKQITFKLDGASVAKVVGIADLNGSVNGNFTGISSINGKTFEVEDADGLLTVYGDGSDITKIADVTAEATIGEVGGVKEIVTDSAGKFTFTNGAWSIADDDGVVTFGMSASKVVSISDLVGTVSGGFSSVTVNGKSVQIAGDSAIALVGSASGVSEIQSLTGGAVITAADGISVAKTDSAGAFTFADGKVVNIAGDDAVTFELDGKGNLVSIQDLEESATVSGDLNGISIGDGEKFSVDVNDNLWYNNGTLSGVVDGNTVISADGATTVKVASDGVYTFANGAFTIGGDSTGVDFLVKDTNIVIGIDELDENASVTGALNGLKINGGESIGVANDSVFGAVAGDGELAKLFGISDGADVSAAGGASQFVTDEAGDFTILGTKMAIADDNSVIFTASEEGITAIDDLQGTATGDFTNEIAINGGSSVQILGDSAIAVTATDNGVESISEVGGEVTVVADGGAAAINTNEVGTFTFQASGQSFAFTGDDSITFALEDGTVTGVGNFDQEGTLDFGSDVEELAVNGTDMTFDTTTNVSLSLANGAVNYVKGVTDEVTGLENATVEATKAMTVNGTEVDVQGDEDYKIIVANGEVVGLADISGGAKVNVEGELSIAVDTNGDLEINGDKYNFNDSVDGAFNLTTDEEGDLEGVSEFAGAMVIDQPDGKGFEINSNEIEFALSTADSVTVATDGAEINSVNQLANGDVINGDLNNASIAMGATSSTIDGQGTFLTVNGDEYQLLGDADGVSVNGARGVAGLDENASLKVSNAGDYTVNGASDTADANAVWVGDDGGNSAYIYDPTQRVIGRSTPVEAIEEMLGLPTEYPSVLGGDDADHTDPDVEDPLTTAGLSALFANGDIHQQLEVFASNEEKALQEMDFSGDDRFSKKVNMFYGDQAVAFGDSGQNLAVIEANANGNKEVEMGDGGDAAIVKSDKGTVDITGGAGDDNVVVQGSAPVNFDMSEGGADKLMTFPKANAHVTFEGYDPFANPNAGVQIADRRYEDIVAAILNGLLNFSNGQMSIGTDASAHSEIDLGTNFVNLFNYLGIKLSVGFTPDEGGLVDGSASQEPLILIGNKDGNKSGSSNLLGGTGDDTAFLGAGDTADLGAGNNTAVLQDDPNRGGADIVLRLGRTLIQNFNGTFNEHGDNLNMDLTDANITFDGTNVVIVGNGFSATLASVYTNGQLSYDAAADLAESADLVESADSVTSGFEAKEGDYTNVLFNENVKAAIAKEGGVIDVKVDRTERANTYIGNNSGLTFYGKDGEVLVNLAEGTGSIDTEAVTYEGINSVAAGTGKTTFIGSDNNETFIAGTGDDSMYGAGGKNLMIGHNDAAGDKTGQTSFFVVAANDGAANTIKGFNFVDDDNWDVNTNKITADRLDTEVLYDEVRTEDGAVQISGDDVVITVNNRNNSNVESVIIEGARGKDFLVSGVNGDVVAQVNTNSLVADKFANYFVATEKNATLTVSDDKDSYNIYLGGRPIGTDYEGEVPVFYGDIQVIDARGSNATAELGGNEYDNTIYAGSGATSLWGGDGGNDLLVAGTGKDTFIYNYGNGNDTVDGAKDGDVVDLTNIQLDQIVDAASAITDNGVELKFSDGSSLTVNSTANVEYKVGETTYVVDDGEWKTK